MPRRVTLMSVLHRLERTNFAIPEPPMPAGAGKVTVQEAWLMSVCEAIDAFVNSDDWLKK